MSFPNGSAGGPDGLRPQHLKDLLSSAVNEDPLLQSITDFSNLLLEGKTPQLVRPVLFGASLIALSKKGGGVRPIAVGYVWRRLTGKSACQKVADHCAAILAPRQVGFGVRAGCEGAVHAARRYLSVPCLDQVFLKVDFSNAFNSIRRDSMLEAVAQHIPALYRFIESAYGAGSTLKFGDFSIFSEEGVQQGDPLGPLLFCLTLQSVLSSLKSEFVVGYLDDISIGGDYNAVLDDLIHLEAAATSIGLSLNRSKCEVIGHSDESREMWSRNGVVIREVDLEKAILLGSPLTTGPCVDKVLESKRLELQALSEKLPYMPRHDCLFLLSNIIAMPRLLYTLRTTPCMDSQELILYDDLLKVSLGICLNIDLSQAAWKQASLPVKMGGLGIRSAALLAPSAFLASAAGAENLMLSLLPVRFQSLTEPSISKTSDIWRTRVDPTVSQPVNSQRSIQKNWDLPCCAFLASALLRAAQTDVDKARLLAAATSSSGSWLKALPLAAIGLKLDDEAVRIAVGLRLGTALCEPHQCPCGAAVDCRGIHGLSCKVSAGRHSRHSNLNELVLRSLQRAGIPSMREPTGLCRSDGKRPDGVTLIPWCRGRCMAWDVTVVDTIAPSHVSDSVQKASSAATKAETLKIQKYASIAQTHIFTPLAFETLGAWAPQCEVFMKELGRRLVQATGEKKEPSYLRQRLSLAIQRGNAIACRGTMVANIGTLTLDL